MLMNKLGLEFILQLPAEVWYIITDLKQAKFSLPIGFKFESTLIGINLEENKITYFFNIPLRNHSATFEIIYNAKDQNIIFAMQFIGEARERFQMMAEFIKLFSSIVNVPIVQGPLVNQRQGFLDFAFKLSDKNQVVPLLQLIQDLISASFNEGLVQMEWFPDANKALEILMKKFPVTTNDEFKNLILGFIKANADKFDFEKIKEISKSLLDSPEEQSKNIGASIIHAFLINVTKKVPDEFYNYVFDEGIKYKPLWLLPQLMNFEKVSHSIIMKVVDFAVELSKSNKESDVADYINLSTPSLELVMRIKLATLLKYNQDMILRILIRN